MLNPFTPFGDCSLVRMANLYANCAQLGRPQDLALCLDMVTRLPARLMNIADYGIAVGEPADLVVLDCQDAAMATAEIAPPLMGFKNGRKTFTRPAAIAASSRSRRRFSKAGRSDLMSPRRLTAWRRDRPSPR